MQPQLSSLYADPPAIATYDIEYHIASLNKLHPQITHL
jgi:hypothetical protein